MFYVLFIYNVAGCVFGPLAIAWEKMKHDIPTPPPHSYAFSYTWFPNNFLKSSQLFSNF